MSFIPPDIPQRAAFGELLTIQKTFSAGWNFFQGLDPNNVSVNVTGSGTVSQANGIATLASGTTTGSTASVETSEVVKYLNGTGIEALFTAIFQVGTTGTLAEIGVGDDQNGFFFQELAGAFGICIRRAGVDGPIAQTAWNEDKMDGTGPSGQVLDITKGNVYKIDYQWLGFGAIRFYVEDSNTGMFQLVHIIKYANQNTETSILVPDLPVKAFVDNTTSIVDVTLQTSSSGAYVQGKPNTVRPGNIPFQVTDDTILEPVVAVTAGKDPEGIYMPNLSGGIDLANSTATPLGAGAVFTGDWVNVEGYEAVSVSARADELSAVDGIFTQFADDALGTNTRTARRETYGADSVDNLAYYTWHGTLGRFMRVVWTNGVTPQLDFFVSTELHVQSTELPQSPLTSSLSGGTPAVVTRSVLAGRLDDGSNAYDNVNIHQSGGFQSLAVGQGHRISQMFGRAYQQIDNGFTELTADTLLFTVPANNELHITSVHVSLTNTSLASAGKIVLADSLSADTGDAFFSTFVNEAAGGAGSSQVSANITQTYPEPVTITNGVFFNEILGTIEANVHIIGYLEPT